MTSIWERARRSDDRCPFCAKTFHPVDEAPCAHRMLRHDWGEEGGYWEGPFALPMHDVLQRFLDLAWGGQRPVWGHEEVVAGFDSRDSGFFLYRVGRHFHAEVDRSKINFDALGLYDQIHDYVVRDLMGNEKYHPVDDLEAIITNYLTALVPDLVYTQTDEGQVLIWAEDSDRAWDEYSTLAEPICEAFVRAVAIAEDEMTEDGWRPGRIPPA